MFYSDGATTNPGWEVVYECSTIVNISVKQNNNTKIYPSPFQEKINIENLKKNSTIGIYDALGKLLYKTTTVQSFVEIYLNDVSKGMYYVIVKNHNTNLIKRIVKI